jgi:hypothetical protein
MKETLEEAAEKYVKEDNNNRYYNDFIAGAKWQQERSYSEEDLILFYDFIEKHQLRKYGDVWKRITNDPNVKPLNFEPVNDKYVIEWFEQFKKK